MHQRITVNIFRLLIIIILLILILSYLRQFWLQPKLIMSSVKLIHLEYEVFGRVQGVFFRKYTQQKAKSINVRGWIRNTEKRTVEGELEGTNEAIFEFLSHQTKNLEWWFSKQRQV